VKGEGEITAELDTTMTPELEKEGKVREVIRKIQQLRKENRCAIDDTITLSLPETLKSLGEAHIDQIKRDTLSTTVLWGDSYSISTSK